MQRLLTGYPNQTLLRVIKSYEREGNFLNEYNHCDRAVQFNLEK